VTVAEGFVFGLAFVALLYWGWHRRSPMLLYAFAGVAALAAAVGSFAFFTAQQTPYAWIFVAGLAWAGFMLDRFR
jgi:hypothetical protein